MASGALVFSNNLAQTDKIKRSLFESAFIFWHSPVSCSSLYCPTYLNYVKDYGLVFQWGNVIKYILKYWT